MKNIRFVALGDLIVDCYYNGTKLLGMDGGSSRFNVVANLADMNCQTAIIGGCGNDKKGKTILKRLEHIGVDTSKIFVKDRATRAYHLSINHSMLPKITYKCGKESPKDGSCTWYEDSLDDIPYCQSNIKNTDVIVLDMLDEFSLNVINNFKCDKVLDIGNTKRLDKLHDSQISSIRKKIEIIQLNERVVPYFMQRFRCKNISEIYKFLQPKLIIITHARDGADFVFKDSVYRKNLLRSANEIDDTGAGDAFLSVFVKNYYENYKTVDHEFIDNTFREATILTSDVVQHIGARGHIYEKTLEEIKQKNKEKEDKEIEYEL